jgi:hypothetical protein
MTSSMDRDLIPLPPRGPLWALVVEEQFIPTEPKANTSKEVEMAKDEPKVPEFDVDKVEALLSILHDLGGSNEYPSVKASAVMQLKMIDRELWEELYPDQAEAERARLEEIQRMEEERAKQREEEKAAREKEKAA